MSHENILVIAVDGLRASSLGAYGNTSYSTPALDQFAAESLLFDWCFGESVDLPTIYYELWSGDAALLRSLADEGYATTLVTDDPAVAALPIAVAFGDRVELPTHEPARAESIAETSLAQLFSAAIEEIEAQQSELRLIWVHARGLHGPWDAPLVLQEELLAREEGDPPPDDELQPPDLILSAASDPDLAFRASCAYAAQVMALDACIAGVCDAIEAAGREDWLVVLCGVRGFPLGEHGRIGGIDARLYAEQMHVPLVVRFAGGDQRMARRGELVALADLPHFIQQAVASRAAPPERDAVLSSDSAGSRAIRTADWSLRRGEPDDSEGQIRCELFVRPDDRWEANDVAALCPDVVDELLARLPAARES
jgi:arylsulfatase A-like enzyme